MNPKYLLPREGSVCTFSVIHVTGTFPAHEGFIWKPKIVLLGECELCSRAICPRYLRPCKIKWKTLRPLLEECHALFSASSVHSEGLRKACWRRCIVAWMRWDEFLEMTQADPEHTSSLPRSLYVGTGEEQQDTPSSETGLVLCAYTY